MGYVIAFLLGGVIAGAGVFIMMLEQRRRLAAERSKQKEQAKSINETIDKLNKAKEKLHDDSAKLKQKQQDFEKKVIAYGELQQENGILKVDLKNLDIERRKLKLDRDTQTARQDELDRQTNELAGRYLKENVKWIGTRLTSNNFTTCKDRLLQVIERCRKIEFDIPEPQEAQLIQDLKELYEKVLRAEFERQEQARIKAQIREEQKLEREIEREQKQLERERAAIEAALATALQDATDEHSEEIERLRARLKEAEERSERATSRAQMTRSGHVYVISNIGSFGHDVFKIGMTRRLEPDVRVRELSNASVPFRYDIHMMISCDDAPTLENTLHKALHRERVNKVNFRKEFFKIDIETIRGIVEANHGEVAYVADAEALEFRESLDMPEEDYEFIEQAYDALTDEEQDEIPADDV